MPRAAAVPEARSFRPLFERWSGRVRARLALRRVLTGAAIGLLLGAGAAAALWRTRHGGQRLAGAAGGFLGAAVGMTVARRKRWSDGDVALYLDARLAANEAIATALELDGDRDTPGGAVVVSHATAALANATPQAVGARLLRPSHVALPAAVVAIGWISVAPFPALPPGPAAAPGTETVALTHLEGLEKVLALAGVRARDEAQRERMNKLANDARRLREELRAGMAKRDAQSEIARLKRRRHRRAPLPRRRRPPPGHGVGARQARRGPGLEERATGARRSRSGAPRRRDGAPRRHAGEGCSRARAEHPPGGGRGGEKRWRVRRAAGPLCRGEAPGGAGAEGGSPARAGPRAGRRPRQGRAARPPGRGPLRQPQRRAAPRREARRGARQAHPRGAPAARREPEEQDAGGARRRDRARDRANAISPTSPNAWRPRRAFDSSKTS